MGTENNRWYVMCGKKNSNPARECRDAKEMCGRWITWWKTRGTYRSHDNMHLLRQMIWCDAGWVAGRGRRVRAADGKSRCGESRRVEREVATMWAVRTRTVIRCTLQIPDRSRRKPCWILIGFTHNLNATQEKGVVMSVE
jgi:hypothetical protein